LTRVCDAVPDELLLEEQADSTVAQATPANASSRSRLLIRIAINPPNGTELCDVDRVSYRDMFSEQEIITDSSGR
jgi:hypothetical protein